MKRFITKFCIAFPLLSLVLFASCIDKNYDLEGGISKDISIPGNVIDLPLGSLPPLTLDSLLASASDKVSVVDGIYGISAEDSISPMSINIDPVSFQIDPVEESMSVSLAEVELGELTVPAFSKEINVGFGNIEMDDVEASLPTVKKTFEFNDTDVDFEKLISSVVLSGENRHDFPSLQTTLKLESEEVSLSFASPMPSGLKTIQTLWLTEPGSTSTNVEGARLMLVIRHPAKFSEMNKRIDAELVFPKEFELALIDALPQRECYTLKKGENGHNNIVSIKGLKGEGTSTTIQLLAVSISELEPFCTSEGESRRIDYNGKATFSIDYTIDGAITVISSDKADDYSVSLSIDETFGIADALLELDRFESELEPQLVDFSVSIDDLDYVDSIGTVSFNPEQSRFVLKTFTDKPVDVFEMDADYPVIVKFPAEFELDLVNPSQYAGTLWDATTNTLTLTDLKGIFDKEYVFSVRSMVVDKKVQDGTFDWQGVISVSTPDDMWRLKGETAHLNDAVSCLGERVIRVSAEESKWFVEDVSLVTSDVRETFSETMPLDIDVPLPIDFIRKAYALWPSEDVELTLALDVEGLEAISKPIEVTASLNYPNFICIESDDQEVTVSKGTLSLNTSVDLNNPHIRKVLRVTHFDFTSLPDGALVPVEENGVSRLKLSESFSFEGTLHVGKTDLSLSDLQKELSVHALIHFDDVTLRLFEGILDYPLDPAETTLPFANEASGLLLDEGASLLLTEPQLFVNLTNPLGVPLLVDVLLEGVDASGRAIAGSQVLIKDVHVKAANYDENTRQLTPIENNLLFTNKASASVSGYETVWVESLPALLKVVPKSIRFVITPHIDQSVMHHVDIVSPLEFSGKYKVSVPFLFDAMSIRYESSDEGIQVSLDELTEYLSRASIGVKMEARNTVPLNLTLTLVPYDAEGNLLTGIKVTPIQLPAGDGSPISEKTTPQKVEISITGNDSSLRSLSYLKVLTEASVDHTEGGIALKPQQGVLLTNMILHIEADIETTL
ncbi:MAG: hypothetical protein J6T94_07395 [Bacteroidaceae bacterium]|nr:hypothetical protein [Bacteroidaceae bacterium]